MDEGTHDPHPWTGNGRDYQCPGTMRPAVPANPARVAADEAAELLRPLETAAAALADGIGGALRNAVLRPLAEAIEGRETWKARWGQLAGQLHDTATGLEDEAAQLDQDSSHESFMVRAQALAYRQVLAWMLEAVRQ